MPLPKGTGRRPRPNMCLMASVTCRMYGAGHDARFRLDPDEKSGTFRPAGTARRPHGGHGATFGPGDVARGRDRPTPLRGPGGACLSPPTAGRRADTITSGFAGELVQFGTKRPPVQIR